MFNSHIKIPVVSEIWEFQKQKFEYGQKFKYASPMGYLYTRLKWSQQFVDVARSMILESMLCLQYKDGAYRATLSIQYGEDDDYEILGHRTFGCILGNDFLLDCSLVHERMSGLNLKALEEHCKCDYDLGPSEQVYFNSLLRVGILKPCSHFSKYLWFKKHEEFYEQEHHYFYCISNDILGINFKDFSDILHLQ